MTNAKYVILGGGMVAGYAAKQMVELGLKPGELTILSADSAVPYERPPLSKGFLAGKDTEESILISPEKFYQEHGIEVRLRRVVDSVDAKRKRLRFHSGEVLAFEKLVVATGARVRTLDVPGADLRGIYYLRSIDDSKSIRHQAEKAKKIVVIGGGFIAMEVSAVLAQKDIQVTMVLPEDRIWQKLFTPRMSQFFENYYVARGVRFAKGVSVKGFHGERTMKAVVLSNGEEMPCDLAVAGIGVSPVTELLAGSGIEVDNGVVVNEFLETSQAGIYAAGDVANYYDKMFDKRRRVEHWDNAVSQGQHCARTLLGERKAFVHLPYFFSDVFDLSYEFWGDPSGADQVKERGDLNSNSFSVWWYSGQKLVAAFTMNRPDAEREEAQKIA